jgi:hypothetical protein
MLPHTTWVGHEPCWKPGPARNWPAPPVARIAVIGLLSAGSGRPAGATWYCTADLDPDWDVRGTDWHISADAIRRWRSTSAFAGEHA